MSEHLHHPDFDNSEFSNERYYVDPNIIIAGIGAVATVTASGVGGYFAYKSAKSSQEAKDASEESKLRSHQVANVRNEIDAARDSLTNAQIDVITELVFALQRIEDPKIGNGELSEANTALKQTQRHTREVVDKASKLL